MSGRGKGVDFPPERTEEARGSARVGAPSRPPQPSRGGERAHGRGAAGVDLVHLDPVDHEQVRVPVVLHHKELLVGLPRAARRAPEARRTASRAALSVTPLRRAPGLGTRGRLPESGALGYRPGRCSLRLRSDRGGGRGGPGPRRRSDSRLEKRRVGGGGRAGSGTVGARLRPGGLAVRGRPPALPVEWRGRRWRRIGALCRRETRAGASGPRGGRPGRKALAGEPLGGERRGRASAAPGFRG